MKWIFATLDSAALEYRALAADIDAGFLDMLGMARDLLSRQLYRQRRGTLD